MKDDYPNSTESAQFKQDKLEQWSTSGIENGMDYVAWCHYKGSSIETCDSDAEGAFKVYRKPVAPTENVKDEAPIDLLTAIDNLLDTCVISAIEDNGSPRASRLLIMPRHYSTRVSLSGARVDSRRACINKLDRDNLRRGTPFTGCDLTSVEELNSDE